MMKRIYDFTIDPAGTGWMVIELGTGKVACLNGFPQDRLSLNEADDMAALLNRVEENPLPILD
ncbi:hypothetical protein [Azospirillum sp. TSO22-1]|uniref:hypothetical protein n=1 Tax=Azospirillum sp. TSO22-1 TaxID=716789 RepID=UPI000D60CB6F|nr:hypothetical protein [Azospirillum sp. TSO22-1]PWC41438.1 hypothetical protein TSO221_23270 [Azospirillum sp. TSO22-1]